MDGWARHSQGRLESGPRAYGLDGEVRHRRPSRLGGHRLRLVRRAQAGPRLSPAEALIRASLLNPVPRGAFDMSVVSLEQWQSSQIPVQSAT